MTEIFRPRDGIVGNYRQNCQAPRAGLANNTIQRAASAIATPTLIHHGQEEFVPASSLSWDLSNVGRFWVGGSVMAEIIASPSILRIGLKGCLRELL